MNLDEIARALVAPGKGILAADESSGTIEKRFNSISVASTEQSRRDYREMLFSAEGASEFISGVILYDETLRGSSSAGVAFPELLRKQGIIPGIKVDKGTKPLPNAAGEVVTEGLDGLRERLNEYRELGALFTKWRAVIWIGDHRPSNYCIRANAHALARYAALSQEAGLVPIVEPEVEMSGDHTIDVCAWATEATLNAVYDELYLQRTSLEGSLLKPNMVISGKDCPQQASVDEVADATIRVLRRCVPSAVPGIVFLSGGQSDQDATAHLNAMNAKGPHPWELSFSYGRALQAAALKAWKGDPANLDAGRQAFGHRARMNGAARSGSWTKELERV
jgi:fructose-bisphosphate aldolase class I